METEYWLCTFAKIDKGNLFLGLLTSTHLSYTQKKLCSGNAFIIWSTKINEEEYNYWNTKADEDSKKLGSVEDRLR